MPPIIGLDYLPAVCHAPGIGRYARELVRAVVRLPGAPELRLFELGGGRRCFGGAALGLDGARVRRRSAPVPRRAIDWLHRLTGVGADRLLGGVDLFHHVRVHHPPVARARELVPVPELPAAGSAADERLARAVRRAGNALVFSTDYRERVAGRYGLDPERVFVTPVGCDHWRRDAPPAGERPVAPRVLALGAIRAERHPLRLLEAFVRVRSGGLEAELVLAGRAGDAGAELATRLAEPDLARAVRWIREPRERDMPALVAGANVLVHLADDEGTPVTPLEAFSFGVPVVASRLPTFEEALGGEATLVAPGPSGPSAHELADAIAHAIDGGYGGAERRRAIAARFTWEACARDTLAVWQAILARDSG